MFPTIALTVLTQKQQLFRNQITEFIFQLVTYKIVESNYQNNVSAYSECYLHFYIFQLESTAVKRKMTLCTR